MFPVEIAIAERDEGALTARMTAMREWLDHRRCEPSTFRYTFTVPGILFRIDFSAEAEALEFAAEFGGRLLEMSHDTSRPAAEPQTAAD